MAKPNYRLAKRAVEEAKKKKKEEKLKRKQERKNSSEFEDQETGEAEPVDDAAETDQDA